MYMSHTDFLASIIPAKNIAITFRLSVKKWTSPNIQQQFNIISIPVNIQIKFCFINNNKTQDVIRYLKNKDHT